MIRVFRPPTPVDFEGHSLRRTQQEKMKGWFAQPWEQRGQRSWSERWASAIPSFIGRLRTVFLNKCAYCETTLEGEPDDLILDFFRPTEGALQANGYVDIDHYWWLSWEWTNLFAACRSCIEEKGRKFPTKKSRAKVGSLGFELGIEEPLLLDPCFDDPSKHLTFLESGKVIPYESSERGRATIETLNLNRHELIVVRAESLRQTRNLMYRINNEGPEFRELVIRCGRSQPYAGMTRQLVRSWLRELSPSEAMVRELYAVLTEMEEGIKSQSQNAERENRTRADLINDYFAIGDKLRRQTLHRAFLSIDLEGSTKMKDGQDPLVVEFSFGLYRSFLESILKRHNACQITGAGDGSMSSFNESQNAVSAAIELLLELVKFNRTQNRLTVSFRPRCGIHTGDIHTDELTPIDQINSHVIDVAGHLQKAAEPNTLFITESTLNEISNKQEFSALDREIDGQRVWKFAVRTDQSSND